MTILQVVGGLWLLGQIIGVLDAEPRGAGAADGGRDRRRPVRRVERAGWRRAGRPGATGSEAERRLREAAAGCGRARVLDPVAAELLRYREVREQYGRVTG